MFRENRSTQIKRHHPIIVVSGLPRSGTSLVMQMLAVAGVEIFTDHVRKPDIDNPQGYFESEVVKQLTTSSVWLEDAVGKAVKIISPLLPFLPTEFRYNVIFMSRNLNEILLSQRQMLINRNEDSSSEDLQMVKIFVDHLTKTVPWISAQPNMRLLTLDYRNCIFDTKNVILEIKQFLDVDMDIDRMETVVDSTLYRKRC